jgi:hypothetical protein
VGNRTGGRREQQGCSLKAKLLSLMEERVVLSGGLVYVFFTPSLQLCSAECPSRVLGPESWYPVAPSSHPSGCFSHILQICFCTASATDIVEVLLEMGVNKRLWKKVPQREKAPESEKPREKTISQKI